MTRLCRVVLAALSVGYLAAVTCASADSLTYKNARFGTSVTFPAETFRNSMEPPPNGEGMTFLSPEGASLAVFAMNNALAVSPEELADQVALRSEPTFEVTYRLVEGNRAVLHGHDDGKVFHRHYIFGNDNIIHGLLLQYPVSQREVYGSLIDHIAPSFVGP